MPSVPEDKPIPLIDSALAPDLFADGVPGVILNDGNVHITFSSRRCDHGQATAVFSNVVTHRLVMPIRSAENMVQFLSDFLERMKKQAASPPLDSPKTLQ
jgi:hypothetical protein